MKRLTQLTNVERARILFELFPDEISSFLQFQKAMTDNLVRDPGQLNENWDGQFFTIDFWVGLAKDIQKVLNKYTHQLSKRSRLFADQLFDGYLALYSAHCLQQYVKYKQPEDQHFKYAVELLFM
jgi:hypothetical protein